MNSFTLTPAELYAALMQIELPQTLAAQLAADAGRPNPSAACEGLMAKKLAVQSGAECVVDDSVKNALRMAVGSPRSVILSLTAQNKPAAQIFYNGLGAITMCNRVTPNNQLVFVWLASLDEVADNMMERCLSYANRAKTIQAFFVASNAPQKKRVALAAQLTNGIWSIAGAGGATPKTAALDEMRADLRRWLDDIA